MMEKCTATGKEQKEQTDEYQEQNARNAMEERKRGNE